MEVWHTGGRVTESAKEKVMASNCRYVMPSGRECHGYALKGTHFCYFHSRLHIPVSASESRFGTLQLPVMEDVPSIQLALSQVLDALISARIDSKRAGQLLWGLQIASQNVSRSFVSPSRSVESVTQPTKATTSLPMSASATISTSASAASTPTTARASTPPTTETRQ
jgi:hypothetical protein